MITRLHQKHSLFFRSLLLVGILSSLVAGSAGHLFVRAKSENYHKVQQDTINLILSTNDGTLGINLWNFDDHAALESLKSLERIPSFCGARILDKNRELFASYKWESHDDGAAHAAHTITPQRIYYRSILFINPTKQSQQPEIIGYLEMCDDQRGLLRLVQAEKNKMFLVVAIISAILMCIVGFCLRVVFEPLNHLGEIMENAKLGLQTIVDQRLLRNDEVGTLGKRFNSMIESLASTHAQLNQKIKEVEASSQAKSLFLSNMSHELRTPMHAILNYSEMSQKQLSKNETDKLSKYIGNIHIAGTRLLHMLNDLLDYSKLEAGKMILYRVATPIESVANYAHQELESLFVAKNLRYELDIENGLSTILEIDAERLTQVMINLFSNAIKYSPEGEAITVAITSAEWQHAPSLRLSVKNQGSHIPTSDLETIFELFMQSTTTRKAGGTGLGLCICRQIVEAHNGHIWAENLPESGVAFYILLPFQSILPQHQTP